MHMHDCTTPRFSCELGSMLKLASQISSTSTASTWGLCVHKNQKYAKEVEKPWYTVYTDWGNTNYRKWASKQWPEQRWRKQESCDKQSNRQTGKFTKRCFYWALNRKRLSRPLLCDNEPKLLFLNVSHLHLVFGLSCSSIIWDTVVSKAHAGRSDLYDD